MPHKLFKIHYGVYYHSTFTYSERHFAMYEIALVSSSKARLETLVGKGNKRAKGVLKQLEEPENSSPPSKSVLLLSVSYPVPMVVPPSLMT